MSKEGTIGILVDVSGSMTESFQIRVKLEDQDYTKIQSLLKTVFEIFEKEDISHTRKKVFSIAFGLDAFGVETCDLLALISFAVNLRIDIPNGKRNLDEMLKSKKVPYALEFIDKYSTNEDCAILYELAKNPNNGYIVNNLIETLPSACKSGITNTALGLTFGLLKSVEKKETEETVQNAKNRIIDAELKRIKDPKILEIRDAVSILKEGLGNKTANEKLNKRQLDKIIKYIEPYIFGRTPMVEALTQAQSLFNSGCQEKILFLITDGISTDGNPEPFAKSLKDLGVKVIVCLLTAENLNNPRQLYYSPETNWPETTKTMFNLATAVDNSDAIMGVLLERGWNLAIEGQSRLFVQANHPDIISELKGVVSSNDNDAILSIITRASLDKYINSKISTAQAPSQYAGTCYANAIATVLHLAQKRIHAREKVEFEKLREEIIKKYGIDGGFVNVVLDEYCKLLNLQYRKVNEKEAKIAVSKRRPVVATFQLDEYEWSGFRKFFKSNRQGILRKEDLKSSTKSEAAGHAVVLIKVTPDYLLFMNSWGTDWGDNGFFRVKDASVLNLEFYDVFWTLSNLTAGEKAEYENRKNSGKDLIDKVPESVKQLPYTCPECKQSSPACTFKGNFLKATCPKCGKNFTPLLLGFTMFI